MAMVNMAQIEPFVDMTNLLNQPEELRLRGMEDGCLFFAGLLSPSKVNGVRSNILYVCDKHGWLKEGSDHTEGMANKEVLVLEEGDPKWQAFYNDLQKVRDFHDLALDGNLTHVFEVCLVSQFYLIVGISAVSFFPTQPHTRLPLIKTIFISEGQRKHGRRGFRVEIAQQHWVV